MLKHSGIPKEGVEGKPRNRVERWFRNLEYVQEIYQRE